MSVTDIAPTLIVPRRNFLVRVLGFTAAGATMAIPVVAAEDAMARMKYHEAELKKAWQDYYGPTHHVRWISDNVPVGTISPATVERGRKFEARYTVSTFSIFAGGGPVQ